jgi:DNA excision repair protein ERCC-2
MDGGNDRGSYMENFCRKCGSLLRWDFSTGEKARICSRCGRVDSPSKGNENNDSSSKVQAGVSGKYSLRKGVSPRSSGYASRSLYSSTTGSIQKKDLVSIKEWATRKDNHGHPPGNWSDAGNMFPFDKIRPGQEEFLKDARNAFKEGRFLLANVPTGIGKTAASLSPAIEHSLERGNMVLFMTSKQSQHAIAVDTIRKLSRRAGVRIKVVDIVSKQSMCPRELSKLPHSTFSFMCKQQSKDGSCPLFRQPPPSLVREILEDINDVDTITEISISRRICPHRAALEAAKEANVLICDFNYLFSDLKDTILTGLSKDISDITIIVDEAHNLPDRIRGHQSNELPLRLMDEAVDVCSSRMHLKHHLKQIKELILNTARSKLDDEGEVELDKRLFVSEVQGLFQESTIDRSLDLDMFIQMLEDLSKKRGEAKEDDPLVAVTQFLEGLMFLKRSHILYLTIPDGKGMDSLRISYRNLDPGEISGPIFKGCDSAVLMSGTLSPPSMFGDILGMARSRRTEKEYPSPFPRKNRLVLLEKGITTAYKKRGEGMYRMIGERIVSLAGRVPGNVAVFFPSYRIMSDVREYLWGCPKAVVTEERSMSRSEKEGVMDTLRRSRQKGGSILMAVMGGSLSEGVDYRDNLLSGVIIVGIPFAPPSLEVQSLRTYFRSKFGYNLGEEYSYIYPAVNKILQAAGRSIRSESDRSVIIMMEDRLMQPRYFKFLPEELRPVRAENMTLEQAVSSFF